MIIDDSLGVPKVSGNTAVCIGTTLSLKASGGNTYSWSGPNGFSATTDSIFINNMSLSDSGNYTVTISGCVQTIVTTHVYVVAPPAAVITGLNNSYCIGDPVSTLTGIPSGGIFSGTGISGNVFNPNTAGPASIKYISPPYYGCAADTATLTVTVNDIPSLIMGINILLATKPG